MKSPARFDPTEYTASSDWPVVEPVEERLLRLERLVEVLRLELVSQNKKIERLMPQVPAQPRERR